jgi:hypothetical protein
VAPATRSGTLHQDQFTIQLRSGALLIKVTPLAEEVIRLAAPDTYERLQALAASQSPVPSPESGTGQPWLFLVSFFSREPDTPFQPEALHLIQQGRPHRPLAIRPLTPGWGVERLPRQKTLNAIYTFDSTLDLSLTFTASYDLHESNDWSRILLHLQLERGRVGEAGDRLR